MPNNPNSIKGIVASDAVVNPTMANRNQKANQIQAPTLILKRTIKPSIE